MEQTRETDRQRGRRARQTDREADEHGSGRDWEAKRLREAGVAECRPEGDRETGGIESLSADPSRMT